MSVSGTGAERAPAQAPDPFAASAPERPERIWYLYLLSGLVSAAAGVLVLAYPDPSVDLLGIFVGIDLLVVGALLVMRGAAVEDDRVGGYLLGALAILTGVIVIRSPSQSLTVLVLAFALWFVVAGAVEVGQAIVRREHRWATLGKGLVMIAGGAVILSWPHLGLTTLAVLTGIALVLQGGLEVAQAFVLRSARGVQPMV